MDIHPVMVCHFPVLLNVAYTSGDGNDEVKPINTQPNRKDIATTFTRKLVLDSVPSRILGEHYIAATNVVVTAGSLVESDCFEAYSLSIFLGAIAKGNISSTPPHILFDGRKCRSEDTFTQLLDHLLSTPIAVTQEYLGFDYIYFPDLLDVAHKMRAVLHIQPRFDVLTILSFCLIDLIEHVMEDCPDGRLYLCGVPELVLSPTELLVAGDKANDRARVKVYQHMSQLSPAYPQPEVDWDLFKSHVEFVNPGFRPKLPEVDRNKIKDTGEEVISFQGY
jgi:hypothetical protein